MRWQGLVTAVVGLTMAFAVEGASASVHRAMVDLAAHQTHGWTQDDLSFDQMERRYLNGKRLTVTCGNVAEIGRRVAVAEGHSARVVHTVTKQRWNGRDDGHLMVEVRRGGDWVLYDLDANRMAVDGAGNPIGLIEQVRAPVHHWRIIAHDRPYSTEGLTPEQRRYTEQVFADLEPWYERVLGVAVLPRNGSDSQGGWAFRNADQRNRLEARGYFWVSPAEFRTLYG